ncbi:MAG: potassium transporter TrkG [Candidatus Omnitrophota bacterium]
MFKRLTPSQMVIFSFLCVICLGTIALSLPIATQGDVKLSLVDRLFTATSATCVTGLVVKDTGTFFSAYGRWVIFLLFQMGGLGIMTFSTLFAVMLGRKLGFRDKDVARNTLDKHGVVGLRKLILYILGIALAAEALGAVFLFLRWRAVTSWNTVDIIQRSIFHSVSAFCNAGFALFQTSFTDYMKDPYINAIMISLIIVGGIGFIVIMDIIGLFYRKGAERRLSLQARLAITVSACLIVFGAAALIFFEKNNIMSGMTWSERLFGGAFQSVTARTAGFNTLNIGKLTAPSLLVLVFLMFVGASPGSTGGGIKTCTFGILAAGVWDMFHNRKKVEFFNRAIPRQVVRESLVIFFLALSWIFVFTILVSYFQVQQYGNTSLIKVLFEVVSAFGTVGLSTGITGGLNSMGKFCIIATMFAGRVGPLTLALAVAFRGKKEVYSFPEEGVMVG